MPGRGGPGGPGHCKWFCLALDGEAKPMVGDGYMCKYVDKCG